MLNLSLVCVCIATNMFGWLIVINGLKIKWGATQLMHPKEPVTIAHAQSKMCYAIKQTVDKSALFSKFSTYVLQIPETTCTHK